MEEIQKQQMDITINTTKKCNFNCTYCYEKGKFQNIEINKNDIDEIKKFLLNHKDYYIFSFSFIGGEPTLSRYSKYFFDELLKLNEGPEKIEFGGFNLITNGSSYKNIINFFGEEFIKKFKSKINVQVSYDGRVINDIDRIIITKDGIKTTSNIVLNTIEELIKNNFNVSIKSTLNIKYLNLVPEVLNEFNELNKYYNKKYNIKKLFTYSVTEDKETIRNLSLDEISKLTKHFIKITEFEIKHYKKYNFFMTKWFNDSFKHPFTHMLCKAGIDFYSINKYNDELKLEFCQHASYMDVPDKENKMIYGNLNDDETGKKVLELRKKLIQKQNDYKMNSECLNCPAIYCLKCPIEQYNDNYRFNQKNEINNFYDSFINDNLCFYYKEISKYITPVIKMLKGE